jgi:predicted Holliday junction resolvase-like endonuclease
MTSLGILLLGLVAFFCSLSAFLTLYLLLEHHNQKAQLQAARAAALKQQGAVIKGLATEHLAPLLIPEMRPRDLRFVGDPVDYLWVKGLSAVQTGVSDEIELVALVDVKSGKSGMTRVQRRIRDAIEAGRVAFMVVRPGETHAPPENLQTPSEPASAGR